MFGAPESFLLDDQALSATKESVISMREFGNVSLELFGDFHRHMTSAKKINP